MKTAALANLDRIAAKAADDAKTKPDLLKTGVRLTPMTFHIVVEPVEPIKTLGDGTLVKADLTAEAEQYMINIGRVLKLGPTALEGRTEGGVDLSRVAEGINKPADLIGKYVVYQKFTGAGLKRRATDQKVLLLTITELLAITDDPHDWVFYV